MDTNFGGLGKKYKFVDSWIHAFEVFCIHINEIFLFVGNQISWFGLPNENNQSWYPMNNNTFTVVTIGTIMLENTTSNIAYFYCMKSSCHVIVENNNSFYFCNPVDMVTIKEISLYFSKGYFMSYSIVLHLLTPTFNIK